MPSPSAEQRRQRDIAAAAALGKKRAAEEEALRTKRREKREQELAQARIGVQAADEKKKTSLERKKEWRRTSKASAQEAEADRQRRESEAAAARALSLQSEQEREQKRAYMKELHDAAQRKYDQEKKIYDEKMLKLKLRHDAEEKAQTEKDEVNWMLKQKEESIALALRQKRAAMDQEVQRQVYALEQWKRMKYFEVESQTKKLAQGDKRGTPSFDCKQIELRAKKKIDAEYEKKRLSQEAEKRSRFHSHEAESRQEIESARREASTKKASIDRALRMKLEEIGR